MRATLDPVTSLTGDATQVSELQSRLALHPANARLQGDLGIAYLQRARETNDPSYYTKAHTLLNRSLERDPGGIDATIGEGSLALSYHDFREALQLGKRALALSHGFSPPALAMIGDASVELGRYQQGFAAFARLAGENTPPTHVLEGQKTLLSRTMSGSTFQCSTARNRPVRPMPV